MQKAKKMANLIEKIKALLFLLRNHHNTRITLSTKSA